MPRATFSSLFYRTCLMGGLLGLAATLYFLCGWSGNIGSPFPNLLLATLVIFVAVYFLYIFFRSLPDKRGVELCLWLLILLIFVIEIVLGLVPPTARDELTHHLAAPKLYASAGKIFEIPFDYPSYYPMLLDMLFTPWIKSGWDFVPKLIHGLFGFLTGLLLYCYLARQLGPIYGLLGFFFFVSMPAVLRLGTWAYVDLGLTFYSTASILCLLRWGEDKNLRWLLLAGLAAGFAAATKPNGLLTVLLLSFVAASISERERKIKIARLAYHVTWFLFAAFIPLSPWLARNLVWTGNPFFPFFTFLFGVHTLGSDGGGGDPALGILAKRNVLYGESTWQIAALPLRVFFFGQDDHPQYFDGVLNPILILFLPWAFKGPWFEEKKIVFALAILYFGFAFFLTDLRIRYILPIVPLLIILLVYGIQNVLSATVHRSFVYAGLILLSAFNGIYLGKYFHKVAPMAYVLGEESREAYLEKKLPEYAAFKFINHILPQSVKIYLIFLGRRVYYCDRSYFHDGSENPWVLLGGIQTAQNSENISAKLLERDITHLLVRDELLSRFLDNNLTAQQQEIWNSFFAESLRLVYRDRGYSLYQIHG